eukprot:jgi/Botrbrau1/21907/Bobra.0249s0035.1
MYMCDAWLKSDQFDRTTMHFALSLICTGFKIVLTYCSCSFKKSITFKMGGQAQDVMCCMHPHNYIYPHNIYACIFQRYTAPSPAQLLLQCTNPPTSVS